MDRIIKKKKWTYSRIILLILSISLIIFLLYSFIFHEKKSKLIVSRDSIIISKVENGIFQEYISVLGNVIASNTQYLDAVQPGIIKKIYKESGAKVSKNDKILELSNSSLELNVMTQESALYERISILRNSRLQLDQNNLSQLSQLATINSQLYLLKPQYERYIKLKERNLVSEWEFAQVKQQYDLYKKQKELFIETYKNDSVSRVSQLEQILKSEKRMMESLKAVQSMLESLIIRSPIDGQLSTPDLKLGQSISAGERIGQIDVEDEFKLRANIDEHYLTRINTNQTSTFMYDNKTYTAIISKIYPSVTNGTFLIDLTFNDEIPQGIKRGQNFQLKIELENSNKALLLPTGAFYHTTGGSWIYVLNKNNTQAYKREIKVGRKNPKYFEVMDGLNEGEFVITSSYDLYEDNEILIIN